MRVIVLFVTFPLSLDRFHELTDLLTSSTSTTMEANIPSELDIADDSSSQRLVEYTTELDHTLVIERRSESSGIGEALA